MERRTSSRRELFLLSERAVSQRTSIPWALPPWPDDTSPFARSSAHTGSCDAMRSLLRTSPCLRVFCGVPYGRPEKTTLLRATTFRPNSATRTDTRARPDGLLAPLPLGTRGPDIVHGRPSAPKREWNAMWRAVSICATASMNPHELILPARCLTGLRWSSLARRRKRLSRSRNLSPAKTLGRYLHSDEDTC